MDDELRKDEPLLRCTACGHAYRGRRRADGCPRCGCTSWVAAWIADRGYAREM